jgi:hypothetical protein
VWSKVAAEITNTVERSERETCAVVEVRRTLLLSGILGLFETERHINVNLTMGG